MSGIGETIGDPIDQSQALVRFSEEKHAAIRGELAAIEIGLNLLFANP
jgi:hypothetical protein